jgi:membrane-bound inhibitor of C-type lysozyme
MTVVLLAVVEFACRYAFNQDVALVRDPDHRLPANNGETNADGIRSDREAREFRRDDLNIIFLGDSFVYGLRQLPELAFPQQFERMARDRQPACRVNVANFGWISSSPYLSLRLLREIGRKYHPDVVFLAIDMTDFHDDLKYSQLIEKKTLLYKGMSYFPGTIIFMKKLVDKFRGFAWAHRVSEKLFGLPIDRFFIVNQPLGETEKFASVLFDNVNEIAEFTKNELGAKFILMMYPRSFQYSDRESPKNWERDAYKNLGPYSLEPFALFEKKKKSMKFPAYSLLRDFQETDVFPTVMYDDPHWTEKGLTLVAEKVYAISLAENVFSCAGNAPEGTALMRGRDDGDRTSAFRKSGRAGVAPGPGGGSDRAAEFDCGGERTRVVFREDEARITRAGGGVLGLERVRSASGAKFSNGEATFWTKGHEATMELTDGEVVRCKEVARDGDG